MRVSIWMFLCFFAFNAAAATLEQPLADPVQEARAREIFRELRCVVCQGESIAESSADVAQDMRREIRTQVKSGKTNAEIIRYFTDRYGEFVRLRPVFSSATAVLWFFPAIVLVLAGGMVAFFFRRRA